MDKTTKDKVEYIIAFISDFAKTHSLSTMQAYRYLERFKGLEFIDKFYGVLHTFSFEDAIDDLTAYCHRKGGALVWNFFMDQISISISFQYFFGTEKAIKHLKKC